MSSRARNYSKSRTSTVAILAALQSEVRAIKETVDAISRVVLEGNGGAPLLTRIAVCETTLKSFLSGVTTHRQANRGIVAALILASASLIGTLTILLVK